MNNGVHMYFQMTGFEFQNRNQKVELMDYRLAPFLLYWEIALPFPVGLNQAIFPSVDENSLSTTSIGTLSVPKFYTYAILTDVRWHLIPLTLISMEIIMSTVSHVYCFLCLSVYLCLIHRCFCSFPLHIFDTVFLTLFFCCCF